MSKATDKIVATATGVVKNPNVKIATAVIVTAAVLTATGAVIRQIEKNAND